MRKSDQDIFEKARRIFRKRGDVLKTGDAFSEGIHPGTLYEMQRTLSSRQPGRHQAHNARSARASP